MTDRPYTDLEIDLLGQTYALRLITQLLFTKAIENHTDAGMKDERDNVDIILRQIRLFGASEIQMDNDARVEAATRRIALETIDEAIVRAKRNRGS